MFSIIGNSGNRYEIKDSGRGITRFEDFHSEKAARKHVLNLNKKILNKELKSIRKRYEASGVEFAGRKILTSNKEINDFKFVTINHDFSNEDRIQWKITERLWLSFTKEDTENISYLLNKKIESCFSAEKKCQELINNLSIKDNIHGIRMRKLFKHHYDKSMEKSN